MAQLIQCKGGCEAWTAGWTCPSCGRAKPGNSPRSHQDEREGPPIKKMSFFEALFTPMPPLAVTPAVPAAPSCPKCNGSEMSAVKKGFGFGKAAAGALIAGPVGLAAGGIGSGAVNLVCHSCGHKWKPGRG